MVNLLSQKKKKLRRLPERCTVKRRPIMPRISLVSQLKVYSHLRRFRYSISCQSVLRTSGLPAIHTFFQLADFSGVYAVPGRGLILETIKLVMTDE